MNMQQFFTDGHLDTSKVIDALTETRTRLAQAEAKLEKIGSLKMDTEIAELQHKLKEAEETIRKLAEESLRDREKLREAMNRVDVDRLVAWLDSEPRKPPQAAFTAGPVRRLADEFHFHFRRVEQAWDELRQSYVKIKQDQEYERERFRKGVEAWEKRSAIVEKRVARYKNSLENVRDVVNNYAWNILQDALKE